MTQLLPRLLIGLVVMLAGGGLGGLVGRSLQAPVLGVLFGSAVAVSALALLDTLRGYKLIDWLRGSQESEAPRDTGFGVSSASASSAPSAAANWGWRRSRRG